VEDKPANPSEKELCAHQMSGQDPLVARIQAPHPEYKVSHRLDKLESDGRFAIAACSVATNT
jgi:hypothetical protein